MEKYNTTNELIEMAKTGKYLPIEFVMALYHIPGIKSENLSHIGDQWFNKEGVPVTFPDTNSFLLEDVVNVTKMG